MMGTPSRAGAMTATACLARATSAEECAARCSHERDRTSFLRVAMGWRRVARMAEYQDEWFVLNESIPLGKGTVTVTVPFFFMLRGKGLFPGDTASGRHLGRRDHASRKLPLVDEEDAGHLQRAANGLPIPRPRHALALLETQNGPTVHAAMSGELVQRPAQGCPAHSALQRRQKITGDDISP
jgi:hypothetical protein